jgi:spore germination protein KC
MLYGNGVSLSLPAIAVSSSQSGDTPELDGTAVFKKDKLIGYLSGDETKNFLFVENKIKGGLLLVSKETKDKNIALEILDSHTEVTPQITGGKLSMHISIQTKTALGDVESPRDYETEEGIKALETAAGRELAAGIGALISKVQRQYDSDIFGFGKAVYQDDPQRWSEIKSKWDEMFQTLPVTVSVQIKIQNTATAKSSVKAGD